MPVPFFGCLSFAIIWVPLFRIFLFVCNYVVSFFVIVKLGFVRYFCAIIWEAGGQEVQVGWGHGASFSAAADRGSN